MYTVYMYTYNYIYIYIYLTLRRAFNTFSFGNSRQNFVYRSPNPWPPHLKACAMATTREARDRVPEESLQIDGEASGDLHFTWRFMGSYKWGYKGLGFLLRVL